MPDRGSHDIKYLLEKRHHRWINPIVICHVWKTLVDDVSIRLGSVWVSVCVRMHVRSLSQNMCFPKSNMMKSYSLGDRIKNGKCFGGGWIMDQLLPRWMTLEAIFFAVSIMKKIEREVMVYEKMDRPLVDNCPHLDHGNVSFQNCRK